MSFLAGHMPELAAKDAKPTNEPVKLRFDMRPEPPRSAWPPAPPAPPRPKTIAPRPAPPAPKPPVAPPPPSVMAMLVPKAPRKPTPITPAMRMVASAQETTAPPKGLDLVLARVAQEHGTTPALIVSRSRLQRDAHARHHVWALMRDTLAWSYPCIARLWGVDHTTVMSGIEAHQERARWST